MPELQDQLKSMIISELKIEDLSADDVENDAPLFGEKANGLGLDSLDAVELVLLLQKNYQIDVRDMDEARVAFASIDALADYVRSHQPHA